MAITKVQREAILEKYQRQPGDTGSPEAQIALIGQQEAEAMDPLDRTPCERERAQQEARHQERQRITAHGNGAQ